MNNDVAYFVMFVVLMIVVGPFSRSLSLRDLRDAQKADQSFSRGALLRQLGIMMATGMAGTAVTGLGLWLDRVVIAGVGLAVIATGFIRWGRYAKPIQDSLKAYRERQ